MCRYILYRYIGVNKYPMFYNIETGWHDDIRKSTLFNTRPTALAQDIGAKILIDDNSRAIDKERKT